MHMEKIGYVSILDDLESSFLEYVKCVSSTWKRLPNDILLKIRELVLRDFLRNVETCQRRSYSYIYGKKWSPLALCKLTPAKFVIKHDTNHIPVFSDADVDTKKYKLHDVKKRVSEIQQRSLERCIKYQKRGFKMDEGTIEPFVNSLCWISYGQKNPKSKN